MELDSFLERKLQAIKKANWQRECFHNRAEDPVVREHDGQKLIQFCSNDYLGLSHDSRIHQAMFDASQKYGSGSTGSRLVTGTSDLHENLESNIANFKAKPAALYYSSGYLTNLSVISTLMGPQDAIFSDQYNHACLKKGSKLSQAKIHEYNHLNIQELEDLLSAHRKKYKNAIILTDAVFSMDGTKINIPEYIALSKKYDAWLLVDEAHSAGVWGEQGQGLIYDQIGGTSDYSIPIQIGTCSKAIGLQGGYVTGSNNLISFLSQRDSAFIYSTAASPAIIAGVNKALELVQSEGWRRNQLWQNQKKIVNFLRQHNISSIALDSPIFSIKMKDNQSALDCSKQLLSQGIWIQAIRPPTVPTPRLRLTISSAHKDIHLDQLFKALLSVRRYFV